MANPCPQPQNNIYVGARYVPIFAGTWDKSKTYEPLMIVEYQGNSYTSKTYVPAGVDITNETYWAITGNYNAQVEAYRKEVQTIAGQLDSIETDVTELNTRIDNNVSSIQAINTALQRSPLAANSTILTVGKAGCMFTTINAAITEARKYCSSSNRVTILVNSGSYNENITLVPNPGIDIIGLGVVYITSAASYPESPIYTVGEGYFRNLRFETLRGGAKPTYAFHYESGAAPTANGQTIFDQCIFVSPVNYAVGIGLGANKTVQLWNCTCASSSSSGLYVHNSPNADTLNQNFIAVGCQFTSYGVQYGVTIDDAAALQGRSNSKMTLTFIGCTSSNTKILFRKNSSTNLTYIPVRTPGDVTLSTGSTANVFRGLNYNEADFFYQNIIPVMQNTMATIPLIGAPNFTTTLLAATDNAGTDVSSSVTIKPPSSNSLVINCNAETVRGANLNISLSVTAN